MLYDKLSEASQLPSYWLANHEKCATYFFAFTFAWNFFFIENNSLPQRVYGIIVCDLHILLFDNWSDYINFP